jgi:hypothetical protein
MKMKWKAEVDLFVIKSTSLEELHINENQLSIIDYSNNFRIVDCIIGNFDFFIYHEMYENDLVFVSEKLLDKDLLSDFIQFIFKSFNLNKDKKIIYPTYDPSYYEHHTISLDKALILKNDLKSNEIQILT